MDHRCITIPLIQPQTDRRRRALLIAPRNGLSRPLANAGNTVSCDVPQGRQVAEESVNL